MRLDVSRQRRISYAVLGVGGVGLITSAAFMGVALAEESSAESIHTQRLTTGITASQLTSYNNDLAARTAWRNAAIGTLGGSLAVVAAGGALFLFDHPSGGRADPSFEPIPRPVTPTGCGCGIEAAAIPMVGPGYGGAAVVGRF